MKRLKREDTRKGDLLFKITGVIGGIFALLLWFMMLEAGGGKKNQIKNIRFAPHPTFSRVIFEMEREFDYDLAPDFKKQKLILKFPDTGIHKKFLKRKISDARIKGLLLKESKETGELIITVLLKYSRNSVYHLALEGPPRLVLDVQKKNGPLKHSARSVLKRKSFPELEEKTAPPVVKAETAVEEPKPETMQAETVQEEKVLSPEEIAKREQILAEIEKKFLGKEIYLDALLLFQQTMYGEAYVKFKEFVNQYPQSPYAEHAYYLLGDCLFNLVDEKEPDYRGAIHDFRAAIREFPLSQHRDAALFKLGKMYFSMGLFVEAFAAFDATIEEYKKGRYGLQAKLMKANMFFAKQEYERAHDLYREVIQLSPYSPEAKKASFSIADYLYETNNPEKALKYYIEATKRWPSYPKMNPHVIFNTGKLYYEKKNLEEARKKFYSLVNLYPNYELTYQAMNLLGDSYLLQGKEEAGMKVFSETVTRRPKSSEANYGRIKIAEIGAQNATYKPKRKIFETYDSYYEPIKTYQDISKKYVDDPKSAANALLHEGEALSKQKEFFKAIGVFRRIHEKFPETAQSQEVKKMIQNSFYDMVNSYYGQEGFLPLLAAYHENFDPYLRDIKDLKTLFRIGDLYQSVGLHGTAIKYYQKIKEIDKKNELKHALIVKLSTLHKEKGNFKEAERALIRFIKDFPKSDQLADAIVALGDVMYDQKKYQEASVRYAEYVKRFPKASNQSYIYHKLGKTFKEIKNYPGATNAFQNAINKFEQKDPGKPLPSYYSNSYYEVGSSYYLNAEYEKAVTAYKIAIDKFKDDPRNSYARFFIGDSYAKLKEDSSAESLFKNIAESSQEGIWSDAAELSNNALKWEKSYQKVM